METKQTKKSQNKEFHEEKKIKNVGYEVTKTKDKGHLKYQVYFIITIWLMQVSNNLLNH